MLLRISHVDDAHDPRYVRLAPERSYIISGGPSDIILADSEVSMPHARLTLTADRYYVEDLRSRTGTFIDDVQITGTAAVELSQWIRVGDTILQLQLGDQLPVANITETRSETSEEQALLAALRANPADDATREVYADWLEDQGCKRTAEYIRLELADDADYATREAVSFVATFTTPEWRVLVCRGLIGGCSRRSGCPRHWHLLPSGAAPFVRRCGTCTRDVFYSNGRAAVISHGERRDLVVFDPGMARQNADAYFRGDELGEGYDEGRGFALLFGGAGAGDDGGALDTIDDSARGEDD